MTDFTARLNLAKPTDGEDADVSQLNANFDKLDAVAGAQPVTSTTRPSLPYSGQFIYETDTKRVLVWTGTAWALVSDISAEWKTIPSIVYSTGWEEGSTPLYARYGNEVYIIIQAKATAIHTYSAAGGSIGQAELCTIGPDDILPVKNAGYGLMGGNTRVTSASIIGKEAGTAKGKVSVNSVAGTADVAVGTILRVSGAYPIF